MRAWFCEIFNTCISLMCIQTQYNFTAYLRPHRKLTDHFSIISENFLGWGGGKYIGEGEVTKKLTKTADTCNFIVLTGGKWEGQSLQQGMGGGNRQMSPIPLLCHHCPLYTIPEGTSCQNTVVAYLYLCSRSLHNNAFKLPLWLLWGGGWHAQGLSWGVL